MARYEVRFYQDYRKPNSTFTVIGTTDSLLEAKRIRIVSGDLVTDVHGNIVRERLWLWDWELQNPNSLAMQLTK